MAEQNLGNAIELLRTENAKQSADQVQSTDQINKNIEKFLKGLAAMAGDKEEERRDKKKGKKDKPESAGFSKKDFDGGFGLAGMAGGIVAAVAGFATGVVETFGRLLSNLIPKSIKNAFKNLSNAFKAGTNGVKGLSTTANGAFRSLNNVEKMFRGLGTSFTKIGETVKVISTSIKSGFGAAVTKMKGFVDAISKPFTAINKALGGAQGGIGFLSKASASIGEFFKGIGTKIKGFTDLFGKSGFLGKIFTVFRSLGTKIPVIGQIIAGVMGIFDGFKDAADQVGGISSKIIRFLTSGIGTALGAFFGSLGDMVKWAVSKIAGLFGLDKVSAFLDSFSFEEIIVNMFDSLGNALISGKDYVVEKFQSIDFGQMIGNAIDSVVELFTGAFDWVVEKVTSVDFGSMLGGAMDWGHQMFMKLKSMIAGVLPDVDSWAGKLIPDAVYEYLDQAPPPPVKEQETPTGTMESSQEDLQAEFDADQAELARVQKDYDEGNASEMDLEAAKAFAKMSEMALKGAEQETTGTGKPVVEEQPIEQTEPAQEPVAVEKLEVPEKEATPKEMNEATADFLKKLDDPQWQKEAAEKRRKREEDFAKMQEKATADRQRREAEHLAAKEKSNQKLLDNEELLRTMKETGMRDGKELSERDMMYLDSKIRRIDTLKQSRGADVDSMSRENARQGEKSVTVVAPSSQNVTTNNNQSTAAIMPQNQPTVDHNDRTYGVV